jgi:hypothetical protein
MSLQYKFILQHTHCDRGRTKCYYKGGIFIVGIIQTTILWVDTTHSIQENIQDFISKLIIKKTL